MTASAYTNWRKSTRSGGDDNCVEVDTTQASIAVRDSKNPDGAILEFAPDAWDGFLAGAKAGEFDL